MDKSSLTGTESFQLRIQRSEAARASLMCGVYGAVIVLTIARRLGGGVVMAEEEVFIPYIAVLVLALGYGLFMGWMLRGAIRQARVLPKWRLTVSSLVELAVPASLLTIVHFWSPRGAYAALSGPALLLLPMTVLLSVLSLRPRMTLFLGVGAAVVHAMLTVHTILTESLDAGHDAVILSYGVLLALTGMAGMLVTRAARHYVIEAVGEAEARERAAMRLAGIERDLEVAKHIQAGLLPSGPPQFAGFEFAGFNKPAEQTGGDYYDWQELPNGRLLVVMADVTGHGIGPALVMAVCRAYARASAPLDSNPASLMARLNGLLHADIRGSRFITLAMAVLDQSGQVELVSAGHGPSLLFRAGGRTVEQFGGDGLPLAVLAEESYGPTRVLTMERDDVLVMLTDGVFEWQNATGAQFGISRLAEAFEAASGKPAAEIVQSLHRAVLDFAAGSPQADDVTIVVIKRTS